MVHFFSVSEPYLIVWNDTGFGTGVLVNGLQSQETGCNIMYYQGRMNQSYHGVQLSNYWDDHNLKKRQ